MKYFVTGGAGFIGSVLVNRLTNAGHKVTVYDNFHLGKKKFLKKNKNLIITKGDVRNSKLIQKYMKNHDFVFHFAANSDIQAGINDWRLDFEINTLGTINVLDSMVKNKIKNLVFASTSSVFGFPKKFPTPEDYGPCLPESFYGASKLGAEGYVSAYANLYGIKTWIFRFANITGNPSTHGIIFDFMKKVQKPSKNFHVLGNGNQEKSYITNEMLIDGILKIVTKTKNRKQNLFLYNIGNKDAIKIKYIAKTFLKMKNSNKKIVYGKTKEGWKGDIYKMRLGIKKIMQDGWKPKSNSKKCIEKSIENYWD